MENFNIVENRYKSSSGRTVDFEVKFVFFVLRIFQRGRSYLFEKTGQAGRIAAKILADGNSLFCWVACDLGHLKYELSIGRIFPIRLMEKKINNNDLE